LLSLNKSNTLAVMVIVVAVLVAVVVLVVVAVVVPVPVETADLALTELVLCHTNSFEEIA